MRTDPITHEDLPARRPPAAAPAGRLRRRLLSWRFWALVALAIVDGLFFVIPMVAMGLIVCAVIAPDLLRRVARFLDALAVGA